MWIVCEIRWGGAWENGQSNRLHRISAGPEQSTVIQLSMSVLSMAPFHAACKPGCRVCVLVKKQSYCIDRWSNSFSVRTHLPRNNAICRSRSWSCLLATSKNHPVRDFPFVICAWITLQVNKFMNNGLVFSCLAPRGHFSCWILHACTCFPTQ